MFRNISLTLIALVIGHAAGAQPLVQSFRWAASGMFTVEAVQDGNVVIFKDSMRDGESKSVKQGALNVEVRSLDGFVTVGITQDGRDVAGLFIFERQNGGHVLLNEQPIPDRSASLATDLTDAINGAKSVNGWDASLALRAMVAYFQNSPTRQLAQFANDMELGRLKAVPRPQTKLARMPQAPVDLHSQNGGPDDDQTAAAAAPPSQSVSQDQAAPQPPPAQGRRIQYGQQQPPPSAADDDRDEFNDPFYEPSRRVQQQSYPYGQQRPVPPGNIPDPRYAPPPRPARRADTTYRDPYTDQNVPASDPYANQRRRRQQQPQQGFQFGFPFNIFGGGQ